jgi:hypothetical protein
MLIVYYGDSNDYTAYSDFDLETHVQDFISYSESGIVHRIYTSTDNIVYAIRVAIYKGKIHPDNVRFYLEGEEGRGLIMDKTGRPINGCLPETYLDRYLNTLIGL